MDNIEPQLNITLGSSPRLATECGIEVEISEAEVRLKLVNSNKGPLTNVI
tara:strand:- start:81 stop:230 length:150 start_codon:yes stop_codon:yes gene_type:complete